MNDFSSLGKVLIVIGSIMALIGIVILFSNKIPFIGKLPGDFSWRGKNWQVYFPLGTSLLISLLLSLLLYIIKRMNQ